MRFVQAAADKKWLFKISRAALLRLILCEMQVINAAVSDLLILQYACRFVDQRDAVLFRVVVGAEARRLDTLWQIPACCVGKIRPLLTPAARPVVRQHPFVVVIRCRAWMKKFATSDSQISMPLEPLW
jgi:hypothetical protein